MVRILTKVAKMLAGRGKGSDNSGTYWVGDVGDAGTDAGSVCCRRCPSSRPCRGEDRDLAF